MQFQRIASFSARQDVPSNGSYTDSETNLHGGVYYRLKCYTESGFFYTSVAKVLLTTHTNSQVLTNPAKNFVRFSVPADRTEGITILAYNFSGSLIYQGDYKLTQGNNMITVEEISNWHRGVYLFRVKRKNKIESYKIIVN
jgi:hypothetical protein